MDSKSGNSETLASSAGVSLIERLRKGTAHSRECTWPGSQETFLMVVLSCDEIQFAQSAANKRWKDLELELTLYTSDDFYSELTTQLLARSMRTAGDRSVRLFEDVADLRKLISPDERSLLASEYIELQQYANPDASDLGAATIELIEQALKKKDLAALSGFGSSTLAIYMLGTAGQPSS